MGNTLKPTSQTRHIDIKYFALCEWIERDLVHLKCINTAVNTADHLTKSLSRTLFHRHADYLLGHILPQYAPAHDYIVKNYEDKPDDNTVKYIPTSFTTPTTTQANWIWTPTHDDVSGNPWLPKILWNEDYNPY